MKPLEWMFLIVIYAIDIEPENRIAVQYTMVGFLMMCYSKKDEEDDEDEDVYSIWRFMIDKDYQGKGYGKEAMVKALELIKTFPHGEAKLVALSYEPENVVAKKLYASFGFEETGEIEYGESVAILKL